MMKNIACIILAAGKGERMKSSIPKVLHEICGRPMLKYVLDLTGELKAAHTVVVLGHKHEEVRKHLPERTVIAVQKKLIGTADAVKAALAKLKSFKGTVAILYGDIPLLKKETLEKLIKYHQDSGMQATVLTAQLDKPAGYGRVLRDRYQGVSGIVEEKDADDFEKGIKEINTGIICFDKVKLESAIKGIKPNNRKKEYYLTDAIGILHKQGGLVDGFKIADINEAMGINSRVELAKANSIMQKRINDQIMQNGVSIVDPDSTFIAHGSKIGADSVIYPFTVIERGVKIGKRCQVGPFAHFREGAQIGNDCIAGNFIEIVRAKIGDQTLAKHFCYIADSKIGSKVNIGAGVVTANFDGKGKNYTVIQDGAFIGSDTVLVAPVKVGRRAMTGAGSIVLKNQNIPDRATVAGVPAKLLKTKG